MRMSTVLREAWHRAIDRYLSAVSAKQKSQSSFEAFVHQKTGQR